MAIEDAPRKYPPREFWHKVMAELFRTVIREHRLNPARVQTAEDMLAIFEEVYVRVDWDNFSVDSTEGDFEPGANVLEFAAGAMQFGAFLMGKGIDLNAQYEQLGANITRQ